MIFLFALAGLSRPAHCPARAATTSACCVATGITTMLILQALLNVAVIVAVAPPTGVTLPFISYGGSSLVTSLAGIGILLSISRFSGQSTGADCRKSGKLAYERFDFGRRNGRSRVSRAGRRAAARTGSYSRRRPGASVGDGRSARGAQTTRRQPPVELLWVGSIGGMEQALVERAGIAYAGINTGQLRGMNPVRSLRNVGKMQAAYARAWRSCDSFARCLFCHGRLCLWAGGGGLSLRNVPVLHLSAGHDAGLCDPLAEPDGPPCGGQLSQRCA